MSKTVVDPLIVSLGLYKASGGPVKTISKFRDAMNADLFCFVDCQQYEREEYGVKDARILKSLNLPVFRDMCIPSSSSLVELAAKAKRAPIISSHSFFRYHSLWVYRAYQKWGTPYWCVPHGILDPYVLTYGRAVKQSFMKMGGRRFLDDAVCTIFATKREWEKAETVFGQIHGEVVHWPVELVDLTDKEEKRRAVRERLGIPEDARVILYFGRVQQMKRPLQTIEAVSSVRSDELHLIMVGPCEGITEQALQSRAVEVGLNNFHYVGPVYDQNKYDFMFASDAYVSFSIRENFNHTAAESLSAGLPVLLSQGNDLAAEVVGAGAGWYLSEDGLQPFKKAIESFMATELTELLTMGNAGRELIKRSFSFETFRGRLAELINCYGRG